MTPKSKFILSVPLAWIALSIVACRVAFAAEVSSEVHAVVITTDATASSNGATSYLSAPLLNAISAGGAISSVSGSRITDNTATWTDGQFNSTSQSYYLLITSGSRMGWNCDIAATIANPRALELAKVVPADVVVGDRYRIVKHYSVAAAFADLNSTAFLSAGNPSDGDNVLLFDGVTKSTSTLFSSSFTGFIGWFDSTYFPAGAKPLSMGSGWILRRKTQFQRNLIWVGIVRTDEFRNIVMPGLNLLGLCETTTSRSLNSLGLYSGDAVTGVKSGGSLSEADRVLVVKPDGSQAQYFYSNVAGQPGWRDANGGIAEAVTFAAGSSLFLDRDSTLPPFEWRISP